MTTTTAAYFEVDTESVSGVSNVPTPYASQGRFSWKSYEETQPTTREASATSLPERVGQTQLAVSPRGRVVANVEDAAGPKRPAGPQYSEAFRKVRARQALRQASECLEEFQKVLGLPESAFWIAQFRSALDDLWKVTPPEKAELAHAIAAIRSSIRFNKWNAFKTGQVSTLRRCIELIAPLEAQPQDARHIYSVLYGGRLDVFPSAPEAAYEANESDTQQSE